MDPEENDPANKRTFKKNFFSYVKEYCEVSSIQGLNYLIKDISIRERCWWILVLVLCFSGCGYMIYELCEKWFTSPVLVTLATRETGVYEIPFPAVTICPETKVNKLCCDYSKVLRRRKSGHYDYIWSKENKNFDLMSFMCNPENHEYVLNGTKDFDFDNYIDFLDECKAVDLDVSLCFWLDEIYDCKDIMNPVITEEGLCYSFNMFDLDDIYTKVNVAKYPKPFKTTKPTWDVENGYPPGAFKNNYPRRIYLNGASNGLVIVIFTRKEDLTFSCQDFSLQGVRVSLHMPARIPRPSETFFPVGINRLTTAAVLPGLVKTTEEVKAYEPHKRNCFFARERQLKFFQIYSQANCNFECFANYTVQECGCSHFYMPRDNQTHVCSVDQRTCLHDAQLSYPRSSLTYKGTNKMTSNCDCLPLCTDLTYQVEVSTGIWDWASKDDPMFDNFKELIDEMDASAVKIFFKNSHLLPLEKSELYGVTDFISNAGGILGLFTGFSLFSVAELIYFLTVKIIDNYRLHGHWAGR